MAQVDEYNDLEKEYDDLFKTYRQNIKNIERNGELLIKNLVKPYMIKKYILTEKKDLYYLDLYSSTMSNHRLLEQTILNICNGKHEFLQCGGGGGKKKTPKKKVTFEAPEAIYLTFNTNRNAVVKKIGFSYKQGGGLEYKEGALGVNKSYYKIYLLKKDFDGLDNNDNKTLPPWEEMIKVLKTFYISKSKNNDKGSKYFNKIINYKTQADQLSEIKTINFNQFLEEYTNI